MGEEGDEGDDDDDDEEDDDDDDEEEYDDNEPGLDMLQKENLSVSFPCPDMKV